MKNTKKALTVIVLAILVLLNLSGCGTVKRASDDDKETEKVVNKAPKTFIDTNKVKITDRWISGSDDTVSPNTRIEVYCGQPFNAATFVGSDVALGDEFGNGGSFCVEITGCNYEIFYVVAVAPGYSMSDPIALYKPIYQ